MKKKLRLKKKVNLCLKLIISIVLIFVNFFISPYIINSYKEEKKIKEEKIIKDKIAKENKEKYDKCIISYNEEVNDNEEIVNLKNDLDTYLKKFNVSVKYNNLINDYLYSYQENKVFYGASLIKVVDVLYLIDSKIDLSDTVKYTKNYIKNSSLETEKRELNSDITLKDLITFVLKVSDNSAHFMLADYINKDKLKEYGKSLGAKNILPRSDYFGDQTVYDTTIYLKKLYELLKSEDNSFVKDSMINNYYNRLNYKEPNNVAHKYGQYASYYHDIGIVYEESPYVLSILSISNENIRDNLFHTIAKKIDDLNNKYISLTKDSCNKVVYGG